VPQRKYRRDRKGAIDLFAVLVIVCIIGIAFLGYLLYTSPRPPETEEVQFSRTGDTLLIQFTAYLDDGRVFATNIESVAKDNESYPKTLTFEYPQNFDLMNVVIGRGLYGPGFDGLPANGKTVEERLVGTYKGQRLVITLTAQEAFGEKDPKKVQLRTIVEDIPQIETMTVSEFRDRYDDDPQENMRVKDRFWGWYIRVLPPVDSETQLVRIVHEPDVGMVVRPYKVWDVEVLNIDSSANGGEGAITLRHYIYEKDAGKLVAQDEHGKFIVTQVDEEAGTFLMDYNDERAGHSVTYEIKVVDLIKA